MTTFRDREILTDAQGKGTLSTLAAFLRLSGPGWLQSAITLGGGSLIGSLYLGMLGGTELLWLQLIAIVIGIIMLSAIAYVTLSTKQRPYAAINQHINPVLGVGWLTASILANMIWILPQFSLCYDALDKNLIAGGLGSETTPKAVVSTVFALLAVVIVMMSFNPGWMSRLFDLTLKAVIMGVLVCFIAVVYSLISAGNLDWQLALKGFIPDFGLWNHPTAEIQKLISQARYGEYWQQLIVARQQQNMISVAATAVGINMTFLLPYSMLARGWDKPFRGLARFDLMFGLAIPFLVVTTCIVIASGQAFHTKADSSLLSSDREEIKRSVLFENLVPILEDRLKKDPIDDAEYRQNLTEIEILQSKLDSSASSDRVAVLELLAAANAGRIDMIAEYVSELPMEDRKLAAAMVKPNVAQLSATLAPILGEKSAKLLLGIGALGMGFSTIIILTLINALAFAEVSGRFEGFLPRLLGAVAAAGVGFFWFMIWKDESRTYLTIAASTFGAILLPIAYITFFAMMNSSRILGAEKPRGARMLAWNCLMVIAVAGAIAQAYGGITASLEKPLAGPIVIGGVVTFFLLAIVGFSARGRESGAVSEASSENRVPGTETRD